VCAAKQRDLVEAGNVAESLRCQKRVRSQTPEESVYLSILRNKGAVAETTALEKLYSSSLPVISALQKMTANNFWLGG
jgi:hypothetical protein